MTPPTKIQPDASPRASWADVIEASEIKHSGASQAAVSQAAVTQPTEPLSLSPGDVLEHESFGRCTVHRVSEGKVHMAKESGRVICLRQDKLSVRPLGVEPQGNNKTRRVFTSQTKQSQ